jgi:hypothetical protein
MLYPTIPTMPASALGNKRAEVVEKLNETPILLRNTGVLIHPKKWDELMKEMARLQRLVKYDRILAEMKAGNYSETL